VLLATLSLAGLGVVMSYSATAPLDLDSALPPLFLNHVLALVLGAICALGAMRVPLTSWWRAALPLWALGIALLVATALFGVEVNGARRWLAIPGLGLRFQPAELVKCFTLLAVAALVSRRDGRGDLSLRRTAVAVGIALPPLVLLLRQPDLGSALLLGGLVGLVLLVAGAPLRQLALPGLLTPAAVWVYAWLNPYAWRRLVAFWDPWKESGDAGFQLVQSFIAFGNGGLTGVGLGAGRQKLFYLPEAHTDFILALVAEELGLLGVLGVLGGFAALLVAGTRIARRARDRYALLVAFAMTGLLTLPAMVNAAVVMGLVPTKGLTLPFLSYGRTSLLVSCTAVGLLLGVARREASQPASRISGTSLRGLAWR
jgi:cell division protein FtsW